MRQKRGVATGNERYTWRVPGWWVEPSFGARMVIVGGGGGVGWIRMIDGGSAGGMIDGAGWMIDGGDGGGLTTAIRTNCGQQW